MTFDFQSELAELRQMKSDPYSRPSDVLREAEKLAGRWSNHMKALGDDPDTGARDVVIYLGNNAKGYQEMIQIKTELEVGIALCEEHDRRTRPNRLAPGWVQLLDLAHWATEAARERRRAVSIERWTKRSRRNSLPIDQ